MPKTTDADRRPCASFPDVFFSPLAPNIALAKATCQLQCAFRAECLQAALADPDPHGVMAGFDAGELRELRRDPDRARLEHTKLLRHRLKDVA